MPANPLLSGLTIESAAALASDWIAAELPKQSYPADQFSGRGVVIAAGGLKYLVPAWVCVRALRHVGCTLPIEIWYRGPAERIPAIEALLEPYGVTFRDAYAVRERHPHARLNGWELKPFAIQWSAFEEVLFIDADNVPVCDPSYLLDDPHYRETGIILWPDYHILRPDRDAWKIFGCAYDPRWERQCESGQLVIDKRRGWRQLCLCDWYGQRSEFFFKHVYGDKELFHLSWLRLWDGTGLPYAMVPHRIKSLKRTMCQHDFDGKRVFQHRNGNKWSLEKTPENDSRPGFLLEKECFTWLDELRALWSPSSKTFATAADVEASREWVGKAYDYARLNDDGSVKDVRRIVLGPGGLIGAGAAKCEKFWSIRRGRLQIAKADGQPIMDLQQTPAGGWVGRWLLHEKMPVELRPVDPWDKMKADPRFPWDLFQPLVGKTMLELGNKHLGGQDPEPTYKKFFEAQGLKHTSVDLNGRDGALPLDLRRPLGFGTFDMVSNVGTTEHVDDQAGVWRNIAEAMAVGSVLVSVTPLPGDWPGHGLYYPSLDFYREFARLNGLEVERLEISGESPNRLVRARLVRRDDWPFAMVDGIVKAG